jgi:ATPase subunit of ABC transporter with duplicated ATPase domains
MLQVKQLTITHRKDLTVLVSNLSFVINNGDRAAIIGEEGNGKSTILKLLYDPALVEPYVEWTGAIDNKKLCQGYLAQELTPKELAMPIGEFCQNNFGFSESNPGTLAKTALKIGFEQDLFYDWRTMSTLSGGERVKLRLALLMLNKPDVLLLDEPSNDLDIDTLKWLENFLLSCTVPVLYVSHDETLLEHTANVIIHLERLERRTQPRATVAKMSYREYMNNRSAIFTKQEQKARKERAEYDKKMEQFHQIQNKVNSAQANISRQDAHGGQLLKKKMHAIQSTGRRFEREKADMTVMPQWEQTIFATFDNASASISSGKSVIQLDIPELTVEGQALVRNIHLWITGAEKIGIVGNNGVGKSTLLRYVADELLSRQDIRAAYMPQNYDEVLLRDKTPVELLAPSGKHDDITKARTLLGTMQYKTEEMEHSVAGLSGGQRAKLLFLSMVMQGPNVLILDEPTRNFSPDSATVIRQTLGNFPGCIISVSHDRLYLEQVCTRIVELNTDGLHDVQI